VSFIDKADQRCPLLAPSAFPDFLVVAPGGKVLPALDAERAGVFEQAKEEAPEGSAFCEHYQTEAKFFIERSIPLGKRLGTA
jgi:hypothetical protein